MYPGKRMSSRGHFETIKVHRFLNITKCDIMDEEGDMEIPVNGRVYLQGKNIVGTHLINYDSMLKTFHFKGHAMGGFGGALKT